MVRSTSAINQLWEAALAAQGIKQDDPKTREMVDEITKHWKRPDAAAENHDGLVDFLMGQLDTFDDFRNPKAKAALGFHLHTTKDPMPVATRTKIRGGLKSFVTGFHGIADMVGQSASIGFPPAGLIVTVVTHITSACISVSSDYDLIEQLFVIMKSFADRINLLKAGMPQEEEYQNMISLVFCKMLEFCTNIQRSITKNKNRRLADFAKALYRGSDPNLRTAYDEVIRYIDSLDKATVMKTLATAVRAEEGVEDVKSRVDNLANFVKTTATQDKQRWRDESRKQAERHEENKQNHKKIENTLQQLLWLTNPNATSTALTSPQATVLRSVTLSLCSGAEGYVAQRLAELLQLHVKGTCDWIEKSEAYREFCEASRGVLSIKGGPGMGKSVLAAVIFQKLNARIRGDSATFVAYFSFDKNNEKLQLVSNMLSCCAAQVAQLDVGYRENIKDKTSAYDDKDEEDKDYWDDLFGSEFTCGQDHGRKLFLVVDGADQLNEDQSSKLADYVARAEKDELQISLVLVGATGISEGTDSDSSSLGEQREDPPSKEEQKLWNLLLDKETLREFPDFGLVAAAHLENFSNLAGLQPRAKKSISGKIQEKADNFLYVDHALRKLAVARIPRLISNGLRALPNSTRDFYNDLLRECREVYSPEEQRIIAYLLTWVTYCQEDTAPLNLEAAQLLLNHAIILSGSSLRLSIQDQVSGRLSRILTISEGDESEFSYENTSSEVDGWPADETAADRPQTNSTIVLTFQEPSLRDFFRLGEEPTDSCALRPSKLEAHLMMAKLTTVILLDSDSLDMASRTSLEQLKSAAVQCWIEQFLAGVKLAKSSHNDATISMLFEEFNKTLGSTRAIHGLEKTVDVYKDNPFCSVFGLTKESAADCLELVKEREKDSSLNNLLTSVARHHIQNWSTAEDGESAYRALRFAYVALCNAGIPEIVNRHGDHLERELPEDIFEGVPAWGVGKSLGAKHYSQMSVALFFAGYVDMAVEMAEKGEKEAKEWWEVFELRYRIARVHFKTWQGSSERLDMVEEALEKFEKAASEVPDSFDDKEDRLKGLVNTMYQLKARLEVDHYEEDVRSRAIQSMKAAAKAQPNGFYVRFFAELVKAFGRHEEWQHICDLLTILKNPLSDWSTDRTRRFVDRAAKACGREKEVRELYRLAVSQPDPDGDSVFETRLAWAAFERFVMATLCDDDDARKSAWVLADILLDEFLSAKTLTAKREAQSQLQDVVDRLEQRENSPLYGRLSPTAVSLAIMRRRLGSAKEFHDEAIGILRACKEALSDDRTGNDASSLRQVARIMALLPDCTEEAKIALACRFHDVTAEKEGAATSPKDLWCDMCQNSAQIAEGAKVYTCVYCTDLDICSRCFSVRQKHYDTGVTRTDSYVEVCPWGHPYLEAPPSDWNGVSDSNILIDGRTESFEAWRDGLEEKWETAWEKYMCAADRTAEDHIRQQQLQQAPIARLSFIPVVDSSASDRRKNNLFRSQAFTHLRPIKKRQPEVTPEDN
ncbi:hypothetical protein QQX98_010387 [Neonectria punicea]|uniref:Fungal STAND N-terminal Goodbye domain-containing protein n=1 Tax=Neonectria punicea TaxID=979145 RepID=A0ABR1GPJ9_9HYPO